MTEKEKPVVKTTVQIIFENCCSFRLNQGSNPKEEWVLVDGEGGLRQKLQAMLKVELENWATAKEAKDNDGFGANEVLAYANGRRKLLDEFLGLLNKG